MLASSHYQNVSKQTTRRGRSEIEEEKDPELEEEEEEEMEIDDEMDDLEVINPYKIEE
nr:hypothetical protein [Tanacetum cinerariifolium]